MSMRINAASNTIPRIPTRTWTTRLKAGIGNWAGRGTLGLGLVVLPVVAQLFHAPGNYGGMEEACLNYGPLLAGWTYPEPLIIDFSKPQTVTWEIAILHCEGALDGISVVADFGEEGKESATLERDPKGALIATIAHVFSSERSDEIPVTIRGEDGKEIEVSLYPPLSPLSPTKG